MADANSTPSKSNDIKRLHAAVYDMDCLAQGGFSEIAAIAKLAMVALETQDGYLHPENIANALRTIWGKAYDIENCINDTAEEVGCNYVDPHTKLRHEAQLAARAHAAQREVSHV